MMCEKPFMRTPTGIKAAHTIGKENRLAVTPFPCGYCLPCRINQARVWKNRILLEQTTSRESCWTTLTYDDMTIRKDQHDKPILFPEDLTNFLKRLRKKIEPIQLRYFAVGEYGKVNWRPHYHIALFNIGIEEAELIEKTWWYGFTKTGDLNNESASYIVGYCTEKLTKEIDMAMLNLPPEFIRASKGNKSLKGGIGIKAIEHMAEKIIKSPYVDKTIIRKIAFGKKQLPLGRYLTKKLAELIGVKESEFSDSFWLHQEEIFEDTIGKEGIYYENIKKLKADQRKAQKKKHQIFKRTNSL